MVPGMNRWKLAFFMLLGLFTMTLAGGLYVVVDGGVTVTHMREGYADCEAHRDWLDAMLRGQVSREEMRVNPRRRSGAR